MKNVEMIAAIGKNGELGKNNELIYNIPGDLKFFKEHTIGYPIIMGMNTFKSLPRILPNRLHVVLTRQNINLGDNVLVLHTVEEVVHFMHLHKEKVTIIGGASVYKTLMDYADTLWLTEIDDSRPADVYFPTFDKSEWDKETLEEHNWEDLHYVHNKYVRKRTKKD